MNKNPHKKLNILQIHLIKFVKFYQKYLSPDHSIYARANNHVPFCKHFPTCSEYMIESIEKKWAILGWLNWTWRILRCMPWSKWWYDPVDKSEGKCKK